MKKIGFIDYYLNEWHADNYPAWIKQVSGGEYQVCYCWGEIDCPLKNGMTNKAWAEKQGITLCDTMEEVIEKSDVLCVLAPDNPETHERLSRLPLMSGKPTYIDKTFAPDKETAVRIFELAEKYNTPCVSTSALRFADEYCNLDIENIDAISSSGGGLFDIYCIHQIEPMIMLLGTDVERVKCIASKGISSFLVEYKKGITVIVNCLNPGSPFQMAINYKNNTSSILTVESDVFANMMKMLVEFYDTGKILIPHEQTISVIAVRDAFVKAHTRVDEWIEI